MKETMITLETQREIETLMAAYATATDTRDLALLTACCTAEVKADYGENIGRFEDRCALVGHLSAMLGACGPILHFISNDRWMASMPIRLRQ